MRYPKMKVRARISQGTRFNVFRRDNFACRYCGQTSPNVMLHVDHAISVKDGGADTEDNLVTACMDCNFGKSSKSIKPTQQPPALTIIPNTPASDGLIGMWGHTFDENKDIQWQFKVLSQVSSGFYVCQLYSWLDGEPTNCEVIAADVLLMECKLYADNGQMLVAYEKHCERKERDERRNGTRAW